MLLESHPPHGELRLSRHAGRGGGASGGDWKCVGYPCELFGRPACRGVALSVPAVAGDFGSDQDEALREFRDVLHERGEI
jgi:hypothetical protein